MWCARDQIFDTTSGLHVGSIRKLVACEASEQVNAKLMKQRTRAYQSD
jgi:hypothetical protein